jgi:hypothetical protein
MHQAKNIQKLPYESLCYKAQNRVKSTTIRELIEEEAEMSGSASSDEMEDGGVMSGSFINDGAYTQNDDDDCGDGLNFYHAVNRSVI